MPIRSKLPFKLLNVMVFLFLIFEPFTSGTFAAQKNPCSRCHRNVGGHAKNIRPAIKIGCEACHVLEKGKKHPKQKNSIRLKHDVPQLCYNCHMEAKFRGEYMHPPAAEGRCNACHNAHKSRFASLLITGTPELCYNCHDKARFTKKYTHKVALNSCGRRCHNPHASKKPYLLSQAINDGCTACHKSQNTGRHIVSLPEGRVHPLGGMPDPGNPGKEMSCTSCHNPHSSAFGRLFSSKQKCKGCHKYY